MCDPLAAFECRPLARFARVPSTSWVDGRAKQRATAADAKESASGREQREERAQTVVSHRARRVILLLLLGQLPS